MSALFSTLNQFKHVSIKSSTLGSIRDSIDCRPDRQKLFLI